MRIPTKNKRNRWKVHPKKVSLGLPCRCMETLKRPPYAVQQRAQAADRVTYILLPEFPRGDSYAISTAVSIAQSGVCGEFCWVEFLAVCFLCKTNPNPRTNICCGTKVAFVSQTPLFTYFFLGLGWPWVGEFDGFVTIVACFPTHQNLVNRKHPILRECTC